MKTPIRLILCFLFCISALFVDAQDVNYNSGKTYTIGKITVSGNTSFNPSTVVSFSRLREGDKIKIPGEKLTAAIKRLWGSNLFSSIDVYMVKVEGDVVDLEININDLPELNEIEVKGVKKGKVDEIISENKLDKGVKVTENLITTTKNYLTRKYQEKGFLNTKVNIVTNKVVDSLEKQRVNMIVNIDRGEKVKIKSITFNGNEKLSDKKLRKAMKNTKKKNPIRLLKRSKYIEEKYKEDLTSIIDNYKERGYRDARIIKDSIIINDDKTISLAIDVEEGEKYTFGKISFVGNTVYTDDQLARILRIREGSTYNGVELRKRIADDSKPDAVDLTNLYQNNGYLFSSINPVEVSADGNVIDLEIRISEGKPAYFNNITVVGNDRTNDRVIYRELRTRPGQLI